MVGNDVVDLRDPDADSTRYRDRFDERVFTRAERRAIANSQSHERERWRFWAAKEASYKLARRQNGKTVFSPRAFSICSEEGRSTNQLRVVHANRCYFVEIDETPQRIHAVAVSRPGDFCWVHAEIIDTTITHTHTTTLRESEAVREFACDAIARRFAIPRSELAVRKSMDRIPRLYRRDEQFGACLSLSHHGSWLAFAYCEQGDAGA